MRPVFMHRAIGICAAVAILAGCGGHGAVIPAQPQVANQVNGYSGGQGRGASNVTERHPIPTFITLPSQDVDFASLDDQRATSRTIPFYSGTIDSPLDGVNYSYRIAGSDPLQSNTTTNVLYKPIALRVHFGDGTVLDPTKPGCGDTVSVSNRFFKGPNFARVVMTSNGVNVGNVQITDGFQRAEFWKVLKGSGYHTVLKAAGAPAVVDVTAPSGSSTSAGACSGKNHNAGAVDVNAMDRIIMKLAKNRASTNQVAVFLTYNVFETERGNCCILGFHSSFGVPGGTQVYSIGAYNDKGIFKTASIADIHAWTHELGDVLDDPFPLSPSKVNTTPPWGGVGQVPQGSCQDNLETGDPLTGRAFDVRYNGFTYHPQELAFFSWFYRTRSTGTGGKFSLKGTFKRSQGLCWSQ